MNLKDIGAIAKKKGIKPGKMKKVDLIRSIQKSENNYDCFATGYKNRCGQENCLWREDCN